MYAPPPFYNNQLPNTYSKNPQNIILEKMEETEQNKIIREKDELIKQLEKEQFQNQLKNIKEEQQLMMLMLANNNNNNQGAQINIINNGIPTFPTSINSNANSNFPNYQQNINEFNKAGNSYLMNQQNQKPKPNKTINKTTTHILSPCNEVKTFDL